MKIFVSHSNKYDFENELYQPLRSSILNKIHGIFLPHENKQSVNTKEIIEHSNLVVAEVSYPATGLGIELGWAHAAGIPIICISKSDAKVSGSLKYITDNFLTYTDADDMIAKLSEKI